MPTLRTRSGLDIAFRLAGGRGRPVLFVHATGFCGAVWTPITRRLGPVAECWLMDVRAHGGSPVPAGTPLDWSLSAHDVLDVVDAVSAHPHGDDAPLAGVGHSMGGALLLSAEAARPGTFGDLFVFEPVVFPPAAVAAGEPPLAAAASRRRRSFAGRREAFDHFASKAPMATFDPEALRAYVAEGFVEGAEGVELACAPDDEAATYRAAGTFGVFDQLEAVRCPVTLMTGDTAAPGPAAFAEAVAERLPSATLIVEPAWGHFAPMEHPGPLAERIAVALGLADPNTALTAAVADVAP